MSHHQMSTYARRRWSLFIEVWALTESGAEPWVLATIPSRLPGLGISDVFSEPGRDPEMSGTRAALPEEVNRENRE